METPAADPVIARPIWVDPEPIPPDAPQVHEHALLHAILWRRGIHDAASAAAFLDSAVSPAPDPFALAGMAEAADRIAAAIAAREQIGLFGDYDVDGVTSTAIVAIGLAPVLADRALLTIRLPRRDEGYGLNPTALAEFAAAGVRLLVAVDCGSTDHEHVARARALGMDVVILDHHTMHGPPPDGSICVSPKRDPAQPYKEMSAAGLAYLLVTALARQGLAVDGGGGRPETALLDLVALGAIADVCPLVGPNRGFVRDGLRWIREAPRPGIAALMELAQVKADDLGRDAIPYRLAPRLNAPGRQGDPRPALDLVLCDDRDRARRIALEIETCNSARQADQTRVLAEVDALLASDPGRLYRNAIVVQGRDWPAGIVGLVAGKLAEKYGRPAVALSDDGEISRGSGRSVDGFDLVGALERHRELFDHFGGHRQAAGMTLRSDRAADLQDALDAEVGASGVAIPAATRLRIDANLPVANWTLESWEALERLQPFGQANERPLLRLSDVQIIEARPAGANGRTLQLTLGGDRGPKVPPQFLKGVWFGGGDRATDLRAWGRADLLVTLERDTWNGDSRLQAMVKDARPAAKRRG
jgi:single-stranded-DNA-specific exonuclease